MLASLSMTNFGVSTSSLPHVIFLVGTAPEYEPQLIGESLTWQKNAHGRTRLWRPWTSPLGSRYRVNVNRMIPERARIGFPRPSSAGMKPWRLAHASTAGPKPWPGL